MKYSKGRTIHRTKKSAMNIIRQCREENIPCRLVRVKSGYRVDKN